MSLCEKVNKIELGLVSNNAKRRVGIRRWEPIYFQIRYAKCMILPTIFIYLSLCMKDLSYLYVFCFLLHFNVYPEVEHR